MFTDLINRNAPDLYFNVTLWFFLMEKHYSGG